VVNATGMGKDLPGSPVTSEAIFPERGVAWELNYRGKLAFLRQAERQRGPRKLRVEDGWLCFLHGWTHVIALLLKARIDREVFEELAAIAASVCGRAPIAE